MRTSHFLVDNGSLRPAATLALRRVAALLSTDAAVQVDPVSLLHSSKVPADDLGGIPAETFERALKLRLREGIRRIRVLPFFIGESRAITDYLPQVVEKVRQRTGIDFSCELLPPLCPFGQGEYPMLVEELVARITAVRAAAPDCHHPLNVLLVDHGSPEPRVGAVRDRIAASLQAHFTSRPELGVCSVQPCSMERREGPEYDFNEPMLDAVTATCDSRRPTIVALLFLSPGRHAGPDGDVATICRKANPKATFLFTDVLGESDAVRKILLERLTIAP